MPTIKDVAREASVTQAVVSRILNADPTLQVRGETRERVLAAAAKLDYTPNHAARALRGSRMGALGLAVHDVSNPVYSAIVNGAQQAVSAHHSVLMLADVDELYRDRATFGRVISSNAIDGLIILPAGTDADREVARAASRRVPTVLVNERSRTYPSVGIGDENAARLAAEHLLDLGHRDIGVLHLDGVTARDNDRRKGHNAALRDRGLATPDRWRLEGGHTLDSGYATMSRLLDTGPPPTAVVAHNVLVAAGAVTAAREHGVQIPTDLSIIGLHDVSFAHHLMPPLTVVRIALAEMGATAVETMIGLIDGTPHKRHVLVDEPPPQLITRDTTAQPPDKRGI